MQVIVASLLAILLLAGILVVVWVWRWKKEGIYPETNYRAYFIWEYRSYLPVPL